ncbi:MAG: hypothetical protein Q8R91_05630, partial [Candidatus Omnitrophota bacterium]|nr:hypothetical protein [Candidatus Omnitrophota bacterium]
MIKFARIVVVLLVGVWLWPIQGSTQQQQSARQRLKERFQQRNIQFDAAGQQFSTNEGWQQQLDEPVAQSAAPPAAVGGRDDREAREADALTVTGVMSRAEPAPVRYAIYQSEYRAEIEEEIAKVHGTVTLEVFAKTGGAAIPLVNTSVGLSDVTINRRPSVVTRRGNRYVLLVDKAGKYTVDLEFFVKLSREREHGPGQFAFEMLPSPIALVDVELPQPEMDLFVEPSIKLEKETVANKTLATAVLPYTEQVTIRWSPAARRIEIPSVKLEPRLHAEAETLISVEEGIAHGATRLRYSILQAEVSDFSVLLSGDVTVLNVQGNDVRDWKVLPKDRGQAVEVYLAHGIKGLYDLRLEYEQAIGEGSVTVQLPEIIALGVEREAGVVGIQARTNVEVALSRLKDAVEIDVKELPASLWQEASHPILLAYKYLKHPLEAEISITRHKEVSVLVAAIDSASYVTLLTDEGKMLTGATFQMRNNVKQFMRLDLPEGATFLSCFVSGNPVKPAQDERGQILVPLEKSEALG